MKYILALAVAIVGISAGCQDMPRKDTQRHGPHRPIHKIPPTTTTLPPSKPLVVAVIDTGFRYQGKGNDVKLCKFGHKDFTGSNSFVTDLGTEVPVPGDRHGHGTHIAGLIDKYAKMGTRDYCLVIIKYYDPLIEDNEKSAERSLAALKYATDIKVDVINYSGGGTDYSISEGVAVKNYLDQGGTIFAAAGNENHDLSKEEYYPAMDDDRIHVIGNVKENGEKSPSSNYGSSISCWELGDKVKMYDMTMTGTSQATAIATGKFIAQKPCGVK